MNYEGLFKILDTWPILLVRPLLVQLGLVCTFVDLVPVFTKSCATFPLRTQRSVAWSCTTNNHLSRPHSFLCDFLSNGA